MQGRACEAVCVLAAPPTGPVFISPYTGQDMLTFAALTLPPRQQQPRPVNVTRNGTETLLEPAAYNSSLLQSSIQRLWNYPYYYQGQVAVELRLAGPDL